MAGIRQLLELDLHAVDVQLHEKELRLFADGVGRRAPTDDWGLSGADPAVKLGQRLINFLRRFVEQSVRDRDAIRLKFSRFRKSYAHSVTEEERRELVLGLALALGASKRDLIGDRRALRRWFGFDAVTERYHRRMSVFDRRLAFALGRLGSISAFVLRESSGHANPRQLWRRMDLEQLLQPLFTFSGNTTVRKQSFRCLSTALRALPAQERESSLNDKSLQYVYRTALDKTQDTWLQCEALSLLGSLSSDSLDRALVLRLEQPGSGDDMFVRRHAVRLLGDRLAANPELCSLLTKAANDSSPGVQQAVARSLSGAPAHSAMAVVSTLVGSKNEPAVRASAVLVIAKLCCRAELFDASCKQLRQLLEDEDDRFVLRVGLEAAVTGYANLSRDPEAAQTWLHTLMPVISALHVGAEHLAVRRWAAQVRERLWGLAVPEASALIEKIRPLLEGAATGHAQSIRRWKLADTDHDMLGRALALLAQTDFGFDFERRKLGARITRGNKFGFRLWRFLYEFLHPGTDKRQAFSHTTGRVFRGTLRAASAITSELAQTKVPGEPLFFDSEEGPRPYLPLVDEMISALDQPFSAGPLRVYSSEGVTQVTPPTSLWQRTRARILLTAKFSHYANLRNWQEEGAQVSSGYVSALHDLGFTLSIRSHHSCSRIPASLDPAVTRFFPAGFALPGMTAIENFRDYFFSVYENSLPELILFVTVMMGLFFGRHIWVSNRIKRTRKRIPLSIGGWGTRGKSGTERLKAALFNALGHTVVSKTTGCEAMFLHGPANGRLREMFLFRSYDKATIWEQANVIEIATQLDVDVFLWECMGLTPAYVAILQQQWMRDDIATITNTYPDHEDIQGPAGINIPQVMTNFIPRNATLITSEEQMLPILEDGARDHNTVLHSVGWLEAGLLTSDVLDRFPYAEHPHNIALVTRLAEELGIDADFAVKEMADRVVPDLGVLKALPIARARGRRLEFVNGMSANERFGCLSNWERMGFSRQDPSAEPGTWLMTVVNNRADRVSRSKVFASILVNDIGADCHFIIGTNLDGFISYVREAWNEYVAGVTLKGHVGGLSSLQVLEAAARRFRIPYRPTHVQDQVDAMLTGLGFTGDRCRISAHWNDREKLREVIDQKLDTETEKYFLSHVARIAQSYTEYEQFAERVTSAGATEELDAEFHRQLWAWFEKKLVVVGDAHASGDQVVHQVINASPPGLLTRIMGLQNIKGTGLDFVYCWEAWGTCHEACEQLGSDDSEVAEQGLQVLVAFQKYNVLCAEKVRASIDAAKHSSVAQNELFQSELMVIESFFDAAMERLETHLELSASGNKVSLVSGFLAQIEAFLDAGDAIKRRKRANLVYRELAAARISHERAALELQDLNTRQKGGWLQTKFESLLRRAN